MCASQINILITLSIVGILPFVVICKLHNKIMVLNLSNLHFECQSSQCQIKHKLRDGSYLEDIYNCEQYLMCEVAWAINIAPSFNGCNLFLKNVENFTNLVFLTEYIHSFFLLR